MLISCVTDNRNRVVAEIRHVLNRMGGSMAEAGSVTWQFSRQSVFTIPTEGNDPEQVFEVAVEAGADDVTFDDESIEIIGPVEAFKEISDALKANKIVPEEAELRYNPNNEMELDLDDTLSVMKVIDQLEELDDVQDVYTTLSISDEAMAQLEEA
jgi:YebC/PmpR family DNA-binding regulatory protein